VLTFQAVNDAETVLTTGGMTLARDGTLSLTGGLVSPNLTLSSKLTMNNAFMSWKNLSGPVDAKVWHQYVDTAGKMILYAVNDAESAVVHQGAIFDRDGGLTLAGPISASALDHYLIGTGYARLNLRSTLSAASRQSWQLLNWTESFWIAPSIDDAIGWNPDISMKLDRSSNLFLGGYVFPGRIDGISGLQTAWYLASHGSYGLYANTGLYLDRGGGLWVTGPATVSGVSSFGGRVNMSSGFTVSGGGASLTGQLVVNDVLVNAGSVTITAGGVNASGVIQTANWIYGGRADIGGGQTDWGLASHGSYGLYTNTGLGALGGITAPRFYGYLNPNYLDNCGGPADFTVDTGGTWTPTTVYAAIYYWFKNMLHMTWMCDGNFNGNSFAIRIPNGFTAGRYATSRGVFLDGAQRTFTWDHRIEVAPGSPWVYCIMNGGISINGAGRYGGQICIYIGG
jgi:hypothetical protein